MGFLIGLLFGILLALALFYCIPSIQDEAYEWFERKVYGDDMFDLEMTNDDFYNAWKRVDDKTLDKKDDAK